MKVLGKILLELTILNRSTPLRVELLYILNLTATNVAKDSGISRATLYKIEKGDPNVTIGSYCAVLHSLGLDEDIARLAANDVLGESIDERNTLRKRASMKRSDKNYIG